ncbi:hypothetical protein CLV57_2593 [Mucilaginibacter auburnensis]|uniref:Glycosyl transferase family 2 n=2 Tax=Mucilaginibacter auburnensis TaxID=1457233 RepID=A0A2H9VM92_9SPHI|nr:hypothetical protein CLV57_2593 [Mucilaginibacter auburnensis]
MDDITLQINISAGDVNYAHLTVPAIVNQHPQIKKRLLIIDCCRPQKTKILDPDVRFPKEQFEQGVEKIKVIAQKLLSDNIVDQLYFVYPDDAMIDEMSKKYLAGLYKTTHGAGGMVNMSYWIGFSLPKTRYVLHYDGDMMLYQKPGFDWAEHAVKLMDERQEAVMAVPRLCPPVKNNYNLPSLNEGRPSESHQDYWINDWFSTRHFLWDNEKINTYLPFVRGKVKMELLLRKYGNRAFPIDPEILMFKSMAPRGARRLVLKSEDAWMVHPVDKSADYLNNLPAFLNCIAAGKYPKEQSGVENMDLKAWTAFIKN